MMHSTDLTLGRTFGVNFDHGEDFYAALAEFCRIQDVGGGYIRSFIAGSREVDVVGACDKLDDPAAPVWSRVHLTNVEEFGGGTLAYDAETGGVWPHIHVAVGLEEHSATGHTSHRLGAQVQFLTGCSW
jgi:predicted DNA-binding protein with PD1-like motif